MELPVKIQSLLKVDNQGYLCCSGKDYLTLLRANQQKQGLKLFETILDGLGALSAKAQALKQIITNSIKFIGSDHRIYIKIKDNKALGFVKVGEKNLFYRDFCGSIKQLKPTCILDIYVHQSCQRSGVGKEVFQKFLRMEKKVPEKLAYDRPSEKLISFLKKHYGLAKYTAQNNNFVIFDQYFNKDIPKMRQTVKQQPKLQQNKTIQNINSNTVNNIKIRPKTYIPSPKIQQQQIIPKKPSLQHLQQQKVQTKRQFKQYQTLYHKNTTSQGFPLSVPIIQNPSFRTTSNAYGNHYHYRNKKV